MRHVLRDEPGAAARARPEIARGHGAEASGRVKPPARLRPPPADTPSWAPGRGPAAASGRGSPKQRDFSGPFPPHVAQPPGNGRPPTSAPSISRSVAPGVNLVTRRTRRRAPRASRPRRAVTSRPRSSSCPWPGMSSDTTASMNVAHEVHSKTRDRRSARVTTPPVRGPGRRSDLARDRGGGGSRRVRGAFRRRRARARRPGREGSRAHASSGGASRVELLDRTTGESGPPSAPFSLKCNRVRSVRVLNTALERVFREAVGMVKRFPAGVPVEEPLSFRSRRRRRCGCGSTGSLAGADRIRDGLRRARACRRLRPDVGTSRSSALGGSDPVAAERSVTPADRQFLESPLRAEHPVARRGAPPAKRPRPDGGSRRSLVAASRPGVRVRTGPARAALEAGAEKPKQAERPGMGRFARIPARLNGRRAAAGTEPSSSGTLLSESVPLTLAAAPYCRRESSHITT